MAETVGESCLVYGLVYMFLPPCVGGLVRGKVREKYGIDGSLVSDICMHCCCPLCAVVQDAAEIKTKGDAPPGTIMMSRT